MLLLWLKIKGSIFTITTVTVADKENDKETRKEKQSLLQRAACFVKIDMLWKHVLSWRRRNMLRNYLS